VAVGVPFVVAVGVAVAVAVGVRFVVAVGVAVRVAVEVALGVGLGLVPALFATVTVIEAEPTTTPLEFLPSALMV